MSAAEGREPTRDQLLAMAYCDGELTDQARLEFEARLAHEPALLREVSELRALAVVSRRVAPREPGDFVRERLAKDPVQVTGTMLAFIALCVAAAVATTFACWSLLVEWELPFLAKLVLALTGGGLALLFLLALRHRLTLLPHDPYRSVER